MAFQEELHQRLDDTVARQDQETLKLKQQLKALASRLAELQEEPAGDLPRVRRITEAPVERATAALLEESRAGSLPQLGSLLQVFVTRVDFHGGFLHAPELFPQAQYQVFPIARLHQTMERPGKGRVLPAPPQPGGMVQHAQGAQGLDELQFAVVKRKTPLALQQVLHLHRHLRRFAGQEHPQILHGRAGLAIIQVHEERAVTPQDVAHMAITVQADERNGPPRCPGRLDRCHQVRAQAVEGVVEVGGNQ